MDSPATVLRTGSVNFEAPAQISPKELPHKEDKVISEKSLSILTKSHDEISPSSHSASLHPPGKVQLIDSKGIEALHIKNDSSSLNPKLNINNCISPQKKIDEMKNEFKYGFFAIGRGKDGELKIQTKAKEISVKAHPDGSIQDGQGEKFESLSHLMASDKYNKFLLIPVESDGSFITELCEKTLDLLIENKKIYPEELELSHDLATLVAYDSSLATRAEIMEKRGLTRLDSHSFMELSNQLPQPLRYLSKFFFLEDKVKTLGHNLGIDSTICLNDFAVNTGGNTKIKSTRCIAESVVEYLIPSNVINDEAKGVIMTSLVDANDVALENKSPEQAFEDYKNEKPVSVVSGWHGHAVTTTLYKDYFAYMNRGEKRDNDPNSTSDLRIYKIPDTSKVTLEMMEKLIESDQISDPNSKNERKEWFESGEGIHRDLNIDISKPYVSIAKSDQKMGNCTAASSKGIFHTQLILQLLHSHVENGDEKAAIQSAVTSSNSIYQDWKSFHRGQQLSDIISLKEVINQPDTPLNSREYFNLVYPLGGKFQNKNPNPPHDQTFKAMKTELENHIKNLEIPLSNCFGRNTENEMKRLQNDFPDKPFSHFNPKGILGDFVLHTNPKTKELKINIKEAAGTGTITLTPNPLRAGYLYGDKPVSTLKDLYQVIPNLGLPCDGEPVVFDNS